MTAMTDTMDNLSQTDEDIFVPKYSDEDLEAAVGSPQSFPTFTCSVPMCATGGGCGTWPGTFGGNRQQIVATRDNLLRIR
jgi:hypothetical protein